MKTVARTVMGDRRRARRRLPLNLLGMRRRRHGMRRRRRHGMRRRVRRGGFLGSVLKGIHSVARSVPIVSTALGATGNPMAAGLARTLGYGRRKRKVRRGGILGHLMRGVLGMRRHRVARRRVRRGGIRRVGPVSFGGYRQKSYTQFGGLRRVPRRPIIRPHIIRRSGMRRRKAEPFRRVRRGRGLMDMLKKAHSFAKEHKLVSRGLAMIPHKYGQMASSAAHALGYGRRKRRVRRGGFMGIIPLAMRGRRRHKRRRHLGMRRKRRGMRYLPNVSHF